VPRGSAKRSGQGRRTNDTTLLALMLNDDESNRIVSNAREDASEAGQTVKRSPIDCDGQDTASPCVRPCAQSTQQDVDRSPLACSF